MKVILLGTGGPRPDPNRQGPSTLITVDEDHLLFDSGRGTASRIVQAGVEITDIDYIFITHHHFDHTGGLADTLFAAWNKARNKIIRVYGPKGTKKFVEFLFKAYEADIMYRLKETNLTEEKLMDIRNMVIVNDVEPGLVHEEKNWKVYSDYVEHGHNLGMTYDEWPCLGYRVEAEKSVTLSGDAVYSSSLIKLTENSDVLIMCCYLAGDEIINNDLKIIAKHVLASSDSVGKIASEAKVRKLVLNHIKEKPREQLDSMLRDINLDYDGDIIIGEDLMEIKFN